MAQGMAALALVPAFQVTAGGIAIPTVASLLLVATFGHETPRFARARSNSVNNAGVRGR